MEVTLDPYREETYAHLIEGLEIDTSAHWSQWDWPRVSPWTSYACARLEEFRDEVILAYRLYNRIGLEHARRMLAGAPRDASLLDAGGGTGRKAIPLALDGFSDITVLDIAPEWLRLAGEKAQRAGVLEGLSLVQGDILDMRAFPAGSFNYALALGGVVSYCGDPAKALAELARVLKPGGELLADGIHSRFGSMHYAAREGHLEALEELAHPAGRPARVPALLPEELVSLALQAGLTDVRVCSEFIFMPDEAIRIGPDTQRWERIVLELEMRYCDDPRFLGTAGLMLRAARSNTC